MRSWRARWPASSEPTRTSSASKSRHKKISPTRPRLAKRVAPKPYHVPPLSRSWGTWITARPPCSIQYVRQPWPRAKPAESRSTLALTKCRSWILNPPPTGARSCSSTRPVTKPSRVCARGLPNLAGRLRDGEQVKVPFAKTASGTVVARINLNLATLEELEAVPGFSVALAQECIDNRMNFGGFHNTRELVDVLGMSESAYLIARRYMTL